MRFELVNTRTKPTVKITIKDRVIHFHSKYDPLKESDNWSEKAIHEINDEKPVYIIGIGAGYHIISLLRKASMSEVNIIELNENYKEWFADTEVGRYLTSLSEVKILDLNAFKNKLFTLDYTNLLIYHPSLQIVDSKYKSLVEQIKNIQIQKDSIGKQLTRMIDNFTENMKLNDKSISEFKDIYHNKKMILVSAGPSLDKQLPLLKEIRHRSDIVIGAVGTALRPLIKQKIVPDFFMITDANPETLQQLKDVKLPTTPLFYLCTSYHGTVLLHKGPKYVVFQKDFRLAEAAASAEKEPLIQTGGSVATALLDLMVFMGGEKIALVGQDLAYTNNKTHASESPAVIEYVTQSWSMMVKNYDQNGMVPTSRNLSIYRAWFEKYADTYKNLYLFNCTEGGAYINGWENTPLKKFAELKKSIKGLS
ncbi:motility associated factor glycosyltransferase family protein [Jeotgalibacillus aurantiacus]|uniref:motility associated factor glycosyltransferase family protein n=1 Tax=Jeotgalibacillus aurantiacus TaxID=2763266 RepID=UPI001D0A3BB8|nr:6-hydroxymethylpterin diphosphokinase MptE-like protein [Jeotgalibacillus aurantiacus]